MAKTKSPFLSMGASGTIGSQLTAQKRGSATLFREKPIPAYRRTLPQQYQRWLYQDYTYLWTQLSAADKQTWQTAASRYHRTGFAHFMSDRLATLPDIVGWWRLDEKGGATASDSSKNANGGTIIGATPVPAIINGGYSFDGIDDQISILNPTNITSQQGTIEFWANLPSIILEDIFHLYEVQYQDYLKIFFSGNDFYIEIEEANVYKIQRRTTGAIVQPNQWAHWAILQDGAGIKIYKNAQLAPAGGTQSSYWTNHFTPVECLIGNSRWNRWFRGTIDQFIIYNRALDATELLRHSLRRYP